MIPYRFTLSRKPGWSKPPDGIGCGRPSRYSNPYIVGQPLPEGSIASTLPPGTYIDGLGRCPDRLDYQWAVRLFNIDLHAGPAVGLVTFSTDDVVRAPRRRPRAPAAERVPAQVAREGAAARSEQPIRHVGA